MCTSCTHEIIAGEVICKSAISRKGVAGAKLPKLYDAHINQLCEYHTQTCRRVEKRIVGRRKVADPILPSGECEVIGALVIEREVAENTDESRLINEIIGLDVDRIDIGNVVKIVNYETKTIGEKGVAVKGLVGMAEDKCEVEILRKAVCGGNEEVVGDVELVGVLVENGSAIGGKLIGAAVPVAQAGF